MRKACAIQASGATHNGQLTATSLRFLLRQAVEQFFVVELYPVIEGSGTFPEARCARHH